MTAQKFFFLRHKKFCPPQELCELALLALRKRELDFNTMLNIFGVVDRRTFWCGVVDIPGYRLITIINNSRIKKQLLRLS